MIPRSASASRIVALLRCINVGTRNRIAMADLRELTQQAGFGEVRTHLQSGNVVFSAETGTAAEEAARAIERQIERGLGLQVPVLARTADDLAGVAARNPLGTVATNPSRLLVSFLSGPVDAARLADLSPDDYAPDRYALGEREIYVWAPNGASETKLTHAFWERRLGLTATARNWNTVLKLAEMAAGT